jgi:S1-C subfamily serine protease
MSAMRRLRTGATLGLAVVLLGAVAGRAEPPFGDVGVRRALREATVGLETGCAGVLAESTQLVLTARHCVERAGQSMEVRFSTGERRTGWIVATSRSSDQAVLFLEDPVHIEPLAVVRRPQIPGTVLYFAGHPSRPRFQSARLDHIGRCPSLPDLPNALFTSIKGTPGDSGAPLVDAAARVVGLVHGGPNCHIATPADSLIRLVDQVLDRDLVHLTDAGGYVPRGRPSTCMAMMPRMIFEVPDAMLAAGTARNPFWSHCAGSSMLRPGAGVS